MDSGDQAVRTVPQRRATDELRKSRDQFETILNGTTDGIIVQDVSGRIVYVNYAAARILGYSSPRALLQPPREDGLRRVTFRSERGRPFPQDRLPGWLTLSDALPHEVTVSCTVPATRRELWVIVKSTPVFTPGGHVQYAVSVFQDVTERRQAVAALRESEERFRSMADSAPMLIWMSGVDALSNYANKPWLDFTGRTLDQSLGKGWAQDIHPDERQSCLDTYLTAFNARQDFRMEYRLRRADGEYRWVLETGVPRYMEGGEFLGYIGSCVDITERKRAEQQLEGQYAVSRVLAEAASLDDAAPGILRTIGEGLSWDYGALWVIDPHDTVLRCIATWHTQSQEYLRAEAINPQITLAPGVALPGRVWAGGQPIWITDVASEHNFLRLSVAAVEDLHTGVGFPILLGTKVLGVFEFFDRRVREPDQDFIEIAAAIGRQIGQFTERKHTEAALRESEERFRSMADSAPVLIWMSGADALCNYFNKPWLDFTGRTLEQSLGNGWFEGVHPGDLQRYLTYLAAFNARQDFRMEYRLRRADGEYRWVLDTGVPRYAEGGEFLGYIGSCVDITEHRLAEEELRIRARQQATVADLGRRALASQDLTLLMDEAATIVAGTLEVEYCEVIELLPDGNQLLLRAGAGWEEDPEGRAAINAALKSQAEYTLASGQPVIMHDLSTESRFCAEPLLSEYGVFSGISVVIPGQNKPFGVLGAHAVRRRVFTEDDIHFLQAVSNVLATAIEHRRTEQLQETAITQERERIAREMHDSLAQILGYVNTQAQAVQELLGSGNVEQASNQFEQLARAARDAYSDVREDILGLRTSLGPQAGFVETLRGYLPRWQEQSGVSAALTVRPSDLPAHRMSPTAELQVVRIIQESLANVRKHARAEHVQILFSESEGWIEVVIEDDGVGFDPAAPGPSGFPRFGFATMRERAESVHAQFQLDSAPGRGTRIAVRLPAGKGLEAAATGGSSARTNR